jgi:hypothetical protein
MDHSIPGLHMTNLFWVYYTAPWFVQAPIRAIDTCALAMLCRSSLQPVQPRGQSGYTIADKTSPMKAECRPSLTSLACMNTTVIEPNCSSFQVLWLWHTWSRDHISIKGILLNTPHAPAVYMHINEASTHEDINFETALNELFIDALTLFKCL